MRTLREERYPACFAVSVIKEVLDDNERVLRRQRGALLEPDSIPTTHRTSKSVAASILFARHSAVARQHTHVERAAGI